MKTTLVFFSLIFLGLLLLSFELSFGSVDIPLTQVIESLFKGGSDNKSWNLIILESRLPRAISAILAGSCLSVAGLAMQTLFRNPLAGPHILGVSSGAGLGVALVIMSFGLLGFNLGGPVSSTVILLASLAGGMAVLFLLFMVSLRIRDILTVLIVGIMTGSISMALVGILQYLSTDYQVKSFVLWTLGSFDGVTNQDLRIFMPAGILLMATMVFFIKALNLLLTGEQYARSMGLNVNRSRLGILMITGALTALITAYCGPIGFVGVIVPHFSRLIFKTSDQMTLWISSMLIGANVMLIADLIAHLPGSARILPLNSITSLIGIPFIFWMLLSRKLIKGV
ncbi:MAG: iron ABC transporter permease [Vicingaceae bacterium]